MLTHQEVRTIAKSHNLRPGKLSTTELIKAIQRDEGNFDCFGSTGGQSCDQLECLWRNNCLHAAAAEACESVVAEHACHSPRRHT